jgi:peptidoglycan biosynthesis protein MviN/MurJ (putative lipid II flippase)
VTSPGTSRLPFQAALTTLGNAVAIVTGLGLAIVIAAEFGVTAQTDGYFAALGLYGIAASLGQSWRSTIVPRLVESPTTFGRFNRYCGATALLFALSGLAFVVFGSQVATLVTGSDTAQETARTALLILWPAAGAQLLAGLATGMLAVLDDYASAAVAYALGSIVTLGAFAALVPALGINALAAGFLAGALVTLIILLVALVRRGWRAEPVLFDLVPNARAAWLLVFSSLSVFGLQILYVISISAAGRVGEGAATIFSYAFTGHYVVKSVTTLSLPIVLAAPLTATWDRTQQGLRPYTEDVLRTTFVLLAPALAAVILVGDDVGGLLLAKFSDHQIHQMIEAFLILSIALVTSQVATVPYMALLTLGRYTAVAVLSLPIVLLHLGLSIAAVALGSVAAIAAATAASYSVRALVIVAVVHGRASPRVVAHFAALLLRIAVPAVVCFGLPALLLNGTASAVAGVEALAVGLALYAAAILGFMPSYRRLASRLVGSARRAPALQ